MITVNCNLMRYGYKPGFFLNSYYGVPHAAKSCYTNQTYFLPLQEVIGKILISREVTGMDFNLLSLVLLSETLDAEDKNSVHRVFYGLLRDWLTLIDVSDEQLQSIKDWLKINVFAKV